MKVHLVGDSVILRPLIESDLPVLWNYIYNQPNPEWKKWDAPYFPLTFKSFYEYLHDVIEQCGYCGIGKFGIHVDSKLIGTVGFYWEHKESNWLEIGISIYDSDYWSKGIGREALKLWISHLFRTLPLVRVGLTTWSGNQRMMKCAESLGMTQEATLRKCRLWEGKYYDSVRYGVLREEWYA